jgi:hypothetical protein
MTSLGPAAALAGAAVFLLAAPAARADKVCFTDGSVVETPKVDTWRSGDAIYYHDARLKRDVGVSRNEVWAVIPGKGECVLRGRIILKNGNAIAAARIREEADTVYYEAGRGVSVGIPRQDVDHIEPGVTDPRPHGGQVLTGPGTSTSATASRSCEATTVTPGDVRATERAVESYLGLGAQHSATVGRLLGCLDLQRRALGGERIEPAAMRSACCGTAR